MTGPTDNRFPCPRCERLGPSREECLHCGVIYAKLSGEAAREPPAAPPGPSREATQQAPPRPGGGRRLGFLAAGLALAIAVLAFADADRQRRAKVDLELASRAPTTAPIATPAPAATGATRPPRGEGVAGRGDSGAPPERRARRTAAATPVRADSARAVSASHTWYRGADGFIRGMTEAREENKAAIVYFYTDWCGYCRRLDRDLLSRQAVSGTTKYYVKIKVNPEHGRAERLLADRYGISGYPSVYVHGAGENQATKIRTTTRGRLKRPDEFATSLDRAAGETFTGR